MNTNIIKKPKNKVKFGLPPSSIDLKIIKSGVDEIIKTLQKYTEKPLNSLTVLDAGCGRGEYAAEMSKYFKKVVGVEPQLEAHEFAIEKYKDAKNLKFYHSKIEDFRTKETFDIVVSLTVFEHIKEQQQAFKVIFSVLKQDGLIYLTAPNKYWLFEQHYGLPFLSWLPLPLANIYLRMTKDKKSFEDCSYSKSYQGMKSFFNSFKCSYQFVLPYNVEGAYFGCNSSTSTAKIIKKIGVKLISLSPIFWNISKGFIIIVKKK